MQYALACAINIFNKSNEFFFSQIYKKSFCVKMNYRIVNTDVENSLYIKRS